MNAHGTISDVDGCPSRSELISFVSGQPSGTASSWIEDHLSWCPRCMAAVERLEEQSDLVVRALAASPASADDEHEFRQLQSELLDRPETMSSVEQHAENEASFRGPLPAPQLPPPPPTQLGAYELLDEIGRGASGAVYRARHVKLDRVFALKVLHKERAEEVDSSDRFLREMKAIGQLNHPHIVRATDAGEDQGYQYLFMEYSTGVDVSEIVRRLCPLAVADACEIARQAALGLQHAHQHGVVHRDVKPSNLLLTAEGQVKLLDLSRETPAGQQVERKLWASTFVEAVDERERVEVEITLGLEGFPGITWKGKPLPESRWKLTREGRHKSQISKERLRTDYLGCLGVLVSNGAATFYRPDLVYHELQ